MNERIEQLGVEEAFRELDEMLADYFAAIPIRAAMNTVFSVIKTVTLPGVSMDPTSSAFGFAHGIIAALTSPEWARAIRDRLDDEEGGRRERESLTRRIIELMPVRMQDEST